jgi:hypothetical protein
MGKNGQFISFDRWCDDSKMSRIMIKHGYTPMIKAQRTRHTGHWRKKAGIVHDDRICRQRGRRTN